MWLTLTLRRLYATKSLTRFYKTVDVVPMGRERFAIQLDGRPIRTPLGNLLEVSSEPLAMAVAIEWQSQHQRVDMNHMRLTSLSITAIDNPANQTQMGLVSSILKYLESDTLFFMNENPKELHELQRKKWGEIIDWTKRHFEIEMAPSTSIIVGPTLPDRTKDTLVRFFLAYNFASLIGCQYTVESLKSALLLLAMLEHQIGVEDAVQLAMLEQRYQTDRWGRVQWAHDVEHYDLCSRVSAGLLFAYFNSHRETTSQCLEPVNDVECSQTNCSKSITSR
ncbi:hypothetical protein M514_05304 [Trichuris suis]|uniref:Uncharacterized protein n=1 Tax=Trichuris suis TaxID=68888 RepID=A0A085NQ45_9BILA|nr:hypothetical protein M513_05304 [Trichuris suis]KFD71591.1 hypothetical protein M514_05304 [Trichuris suis]KHJ42188.1 ATP12 chaperone protein [Trichuris suis]